MKYFTLEWWNGIQESAQESDPFVEYDKYFSSVKESLPQPLIELHEEVSLHDSQLREFRLSIKDSHLQMKIDADNGKGNLRKVTLNYYGITHFTSTADAENGLPGPLGFGDYGYDEVEILEDNQLEHRILFSSGIVITIQFGNINMEYTDVQ